MKNKVTLLLCLIIISVSTRLSGCGILFYDTENKVYLDIIESNIDVRINDQVSITTITQIFNNNTDDSLYVRYAFPMLETASATGLRYKLEGEWYTAVFSPTPQDTIDYGGGDNFDYDLKYYLGETPLIYDIDRVIPSGENIIIELTYVELLPYKLGRVTYLMPFHLAELLLNEEMDCFFHLAIYSQRDIVNIQLDSPTSGNISQLNYGDSATIDFTGMEYIPYYDFAASYELSSDELGLFCLSSFMPDSLVPDTLGNGFFCFIVEPEPLPADQVITKYFTLIIDKSGSMSGQKIVDARDAASFIVQHLNENDWFNIVSFDTDVSSFRSIHVANTSQNVSEALSYINSLSADGSTNISGAFGTAIPQFSSLNENAANIIIFLTDGEQTAGITNTDELIDYINRLVIESETGINIFTFGIGSSVNERLLRTIAYDNDGLSEFLADNELESIITEFFLMINNPVLLETSLHFEPEIISETYPVNLPNLYIGQQMIVSGRYSEAQDVLAILTGTAFSNEITYTYSPEIAGDFVQNNVFLMKIWAKQKIEYLLNEYYKYFNDTVISNPIKREIIQISLDYGVISPFTSFRGDDGDGDGWSYPTYFESLPNIENTEIDKNVYFSNLRVLNNPGSKIFYLSFKYHNMTVLSGTLQVINLKGQILGTMKIAPQFGENQIDISDLVYNLPNGIYFVKFGIEQSYSSVPFVIR